LSFFFFKFHRKQPNAVGVPILGDMRLETAWLVIPLLLAMAMFGWGAVVYVDYRHAPQDTLDIYVIGKQWMWKAQQPSGLREINEAARSGRPKCAADYGERRRHP